MIFSFQFYLSLYLFVILYPNQLERVFTVCCVICYEVFDVMCVSLICSESMNEFGGFLINLSNYIITIDR